jgi:CubicO group peptidase (beta-lactamase class C family)
MRKILVSGLVLFLCIISYGWMNSSCQNKDLKTTKTEKKTSKEVLLPDNILLAKAKPESLGIISTDLDKVDQIALNAIKAGAFPGCQILVAVDGKIIYQKNFGTSMYGNNDSIRNDYLYDIASVTKIAGSTLALMRLQTMNLFSLEKHLNDYLPDLVGDGKFSKMLIRDMMAHQAGLVAWIPFYQKTLKNGKPASELYKTAKANGYENEVAKDLWLNSSYTDTIYQRLLASSLTPGNHYEYSDLGYYFMKKIIEKQSGKSMDVFLQEEIYTKLGLTHIGYKPLTWYMLDKIVPTENDKTFRGQQVHGYVHDPGAAMLGGVGGHAGLFSNAHDLATIMQLFLNKGKAGKLQLLDEKVVDEFTRVQFKGNRRGAGFDKPTPSKKGQTCALVSAESYGHSGFTGTFTWADPVYKINYVFLSNRVCPSAENWKIRDMNIRTNIQQVIYEAVLKRTKK